MGNDEVEENLPAVVAENIQVQESISVEIDDSETTVEAIRPAALTLLGEVDPDLFFSHASLSSSKDKQDTPKPLEGENIFITKLVELIESKPIKIGSLVKKPLAWVDFRDNANRRNPLKTQKAYKKAKFGIFICSPRFNHRYWEGEDVCDEVQNYRGRKNGGRECTIPIVFGTSLEDFNTNSPFASKDFRIDIGYEDFVASKAPISVLVERAYLKIVRFIEGDDQT